MQKLTDLLLYQNEQFAGGHHCITPLKNGAYDTSNGLAEYLAE
jgi:hypothetical protein